MSNFWTKWPRKWDTSKHHSGTFINRSNKQKISQRNPIWCQPVCKKQNSWLLVYYRIRKNLFFLNHCWSTSTLKCETRTHIWKWKRGSDRVKHLTELKLRKAGKSFLKAHNIRSCCEMSDEVHEDEFREVRLRWVNAWGRNLGRSLSGKTK